MKTKSQYTVNYLGITFKNVDNMQYFYVLLLNRHISSNNAFIFCSYQEKKNFLSVTCDCCKKSCHELLITSSNFMWKVVGVIIGNIILYQYASSNTFRAVLTLSQLFMSIWMLGKGCYSEVKCSDIKNLSVLEKCRHILKNDVCFTASLLFFN